MAILQKAAAGDKIISRRLGSSAADSSAPSSSSSSASVYSSHWQAREEVAFREGEEADAKWPDLITLPHHAHYYEPPSSSFSSSSSLFLDQSPAQHHNSSTAGHGLNNHNRKAIDRNAASAAYAAYEPKPGSRRSLDTRSDSARAPGLTPGLLGRVELIFVVPDPGNGTTAPTGRESTSTTARDNVLSAERMARLHAIEQRVQGMEGFDQFCYLPAAKRLQGQAGSTSTVPCAPPNSLTNYFFPSVSDATQELVYDGKGDALVDFEGTLDSVLSHKQAYWYVQGFLDCYILYEDLRFEGCLRLHTFVITRGALSLCVCASVCLSVSVCVSGCLPVRLGESLSLSLFLSVSFLSL